MEEIVGSMAAFLTTASFVPQAIQVIRTKHTKDLSLGMYIMVNAGIACWLAYGLMLGSMPLIIANSVTIFFSLIILYYKIKEG